MLCGGLTHVVPGCSIKWVVPFVLIILFVGRAKGGVVVLKEGGGRILVGLLIRIFWALYDHPVWDIILLLVV